MESAVILPCGGQAEPGRWNRLSFLPCGGRKQGGNTALPLGVLLMGQKYPKALGGVSARFSAEKQTRSGINPSAQRALKGGRRCTAAGKAYSQAKQGSPFGEPPGAGRGYEQELPQVRLSHHSGCLKHKPLYPSPLDVERQSVDQERPDRGSGGSRRIRISPGRAFAHFWPFKSGPAERRFPVLFSSPAPVLVGTGRKKTGLEVRLDCFARLAMTGPE